jgi:hypothetical protein
MSKYTTELRYICESNAGLSSSGGADDIESIIANSRAKIFNFPYPIFDETYRTVLESKILRHYYTKEISAETVGLFKHFLNRKMNEIMPYYNKLYKSELLIFNPLYDVDMTKNHSGNNVGNEILNGKTNGQTNTANTGSVTDSVVGKVIDDNSETRDITTSDKTTGTNKIAIGETVDGTIGNTTNKTDTKSKLDAYSDTPQGGVTNLDNYTYLTNARKVTDSDTIDETIDGTNHSVKTGNNDTTVDMTVAGTNKDIVDGTRITDTTLDKTITNDLTGNTTSEITTNNTKGITTTEEYFDTIQGKQGAKSYSELLKEYRTTFLNIDMLVIDDLSDLFFNLW